MLVVAAVGVMPIVDGIVVAVPVGMLFGDGAIEARDWLVGLIVMLRVRHGRTLLVRN